MDAPTMQDVFEARRRLRPHLAPTPLIESPGLGRMIGAQILVKCESCQPTGAFKIRGGINLISQLTAAELKRGVIAASTGNHGQAVAYAARLFRAPATILVPERANPVKVESIKAMGAEVLHWGEDFDAARERAESIAAERRIRYIHSGNEPMLIAGVGTLCLEVLESRPDVQTIIVPVGGGSGAAAACIVAKNIDPGIQVVGVQAEKAPAAYKSWRARRLVSDVMETAAEGLATRVGFQLPQEILWRHLDDFILVSEDALSEAIVLCAEKTHMLAEGAGSASIAALVKLKERFAGQTVALVLSGGNITLDQLRAVLAR